MTLLELKQHFEQLPKNEVLPYSLSNPFSWRGIYNEVAFSIERKDSTPEENLSKINEAYTDTFYGWKGGAYNYKDHTPVHFEDSASDYTDGAYCENLIFKILGEEEGLSKQERLVKLAFS